MNITRLSWVANAILCLLTMLGSVLVSATDIVINNTAHPILTSPYEL